MLNRQKTLIFLLKSAARPVSRLELTKWAFVLRQESDSHGGNAFYDFLPHKFGPFSFCLYREMDALVRDGYVKGDDEWYTTELASDAVVSLADSVKRDASAIVARFASQRLNSVIDYVYSQYPRFTVNSERKQLEDRHIAHPAVYTAGYEGLSVDAFLDRLIRRGIQRIIDVRSNPIARRYGFHRSTLNRLAGRVQIDYEHIPELGIKSSLRRDLNSQEDYDSLFEVYERDIVRCQTDQIERVIGLMMAKPSVLVCMEADPRCCHRTRLATVASGKTGLPIHDLGQLPNDESARTHSHNGDDVSPSVGEVR